MKKVFLCRVKTIGVAVVLFTLTTFPLLSRCAEEAGAKAESAARGVLERLIGNRAEDFVLKTIPAENGKDVFEIEAGNGKVNVSGSSTVALSRGAYEYLRKACGCHVSWDGDNLPLPKVFPDFPKTRVVCPNKYRHYISVVTYSYTMLLWDWKRWERELDWMALHGYNMPLALSGQEYVWMKVWKSFGFTDEELNKFFSGPAHLPWFRMGNLYEHGGPLPQSWLDSQRDLQKKILARMRELGMFPISQAFAGFVPPAFAEKYPKTNVIKGSGWYGFPPTLRLDPQDPMFMEIGKKFIEEYRKEFGTDHLYLADTFMEMKPQFKTETKFEELALLGETIYKTITAADPDGIWLMSGWAFLDTFWGQEEVKALFSKVPKERLIILDLPGFGGDHWSKFDKQFIYCVLHNYGQLTTLFGSLPFCISIQNSYSNPNCKDMIGVGLSAEGVENNTVFFELLTDVMWAEKPIDLKKWVKEYAVCRYGGYSPQMEKAWEIITSIIYTHGGFPVPVYLRRPTVGTRTSFPEPKKMQEALDLFLGCSNQFGENDLYKRDLVDLMKHYLDDATYFALQRTIVAWQRGRKGDFEKYSKEYLNLLRDIDKLVATRPEYRLSKWIADARKLGKDSREADFYEMNARMLLTVWGSTELFDYSAREWSGLISNFYITRFEQFFDFLKKSDSNKPIDPSFLKTLAQWELDWCYRTDLPKDKKAGDAVQIAKALFKKHKNWQGEYGPYSPEMGIAVGKPVTISGGTSENHQPERAVDGNFWEIDSAWHTAPLPQWICVDLEKPEKIDSVQIFSRWNNEYYQYKIEVSLDGKTWTLVADMSKNETFATSMGSLHKFKPLTARYVRMTMLDKNVQSGLHLVEIRVFKADN